MQYTKIILNYKGKLGFSFSFLLLLTQDKEIISHFQRNPQKF